MHSDTPLTCITLVNVYNSLKFCPSLLETVGFHTPTWNFRGFPLFIVHSSHKTCPSGRCASASNTIYKDIDMFNKHLVTLNQILK